MAQVIYKDPHDPWNRLEIHVEDGKTIFNVVQDAEPILEKMKYFRNNGLADGRKGNLHLFASIPNTIVYDLKRQGIDIFRMKHDPGMRRKFLKIIQYKYPYLKATNRIHL